MSRTEQDRQWHECYEQLEPQARETVDRAFKQVAQTLRLNGFTAAMDDRSENLVAAMARYIILSNPDHPGLLDGVRNAHSRNSLRGVEETENDKLARQALTDTATRHKHVFGMDETKSVIKRFGFAAKLSQVHIDNVASLTRVLRGQIDRGRPSERSFHNMPRERQVSKHPALGMPYRSGGIVPSDDGDPYKAASALAFGEHPGPVTMVEIENALTKAGVEHTIVRGDGGSFDGGGASMSDWSTDASPSSSDPS